MLPKRLDRRACHVGRSGRTRFRRQSSGLVREVSIVNAPLFNARAFVGRTLGGAPWIAVLDGLPTVRLRSTTTPGRQA
jgi:hypothetical protein